MNRALVIGASGFVGRRTVGALAASGFDVHASSRRKVPTTVSDSGATTHSLDPIDQDAVVRLCHEIRVTHLVLLGWYAEPGRFWHSLDNLASLASNVAAVNGFLTAGGRHVIAAGTGAEYFPGSSAVTVDAAERVDETLYGRSKDALRAVATIACRTAGARLAWGRIFNVFGPGEPEQKIVTSMIAACRSSTPFAVRDSTLRSDYIFVDDVAEAFAALASSDANGAFDIGTGRGHTPLEVADAVSAACRRTLAIESGEALPAKPYLADAETIARAIGWRAKRDLESGVRATARASHGVHT